MTLLNNLKDIREDLSDAKKALIKEAKNSMLLNNSGYYETVEAAIIKAESDEEANKAFSRIYGQVRCGYGRSGLEG